MVIRFDKYEKLGAYHWDIYNTNLLYKLHVNTIKKFFSRRDRGTLLDVGCGDGFISYVLAEIGYEILGIDTNATGIKLAKEKTNKARFEVNRIENIKEKVDYVLLSNTVEHVEDDIKTLDCASRLATTGTLVSTITLDEKLPKDKYNARDYTNKSFTKLMTDRFKDVLIFTVKPEIYAWCVGRKS